MGRIKERAIIAMNNEHHGVRSDGAGSPYIVLDAKTGKVVSGVLVLFPQLDLRASELLTQYAEAMDEHCPAKHDLTRWAREVLEMWEYIVRCKTGDDDNRESKL